MKRKNLFLLLLICLIINVYNVHASDDGFYLIIDEKTFDECLKTESTCRLLSNIKTSTVKIIKNELILDLNGHSITPEESLKLRSGFIYVDRGAKLTINDTSNTGKISTGTSGNVWGAIELIKTNNTNDYAQLEVNGGTIEGYYYGIVGNGKNNNTKVTINGGTIKGLNKEDSVAIFQPQKGDLVINDGIMLGGTAIEVRAGNITVNNGTIKGIASKFSKVANKSGSTTNGAGITIAQHTTKNPIKAVIYDGNISGQYAFYEWNPHNNSKEDINKINLNIYGGEFTSLDQNGSAVYSQDFTNFISGGKFNTKVTEYLTNDAKVASNIVAENINTNVEKNNLISKIFLFITILMLAVIGGVIYYRKKQQNVLKTI